MTTLSVKDLQQRYQCGEHTVLGWIHQGELKAINVARKLGSRPRWRITEEALAAFEDSRSPTPSAPRTRRRKQQAPNFKEFY